MDAIAIIGVILSALAIIVAARSSHRSHTTSVEQLDLQRRLLLLESRREEERSEETHRASLSAEIARVGRNYRLVIQNRGQHKADNVVVTIDDQPVLEHDLVPRGLPEINEVAAGGSIGYMLAPTSGSPTSVRVSIAWEDGTGEPRDWSSILGVYS